MSKPSVLVDLLEKRMAAAEALLARAHGYIETEGKSKKLVHDIADFLWPGQYERPGDSVSEGREK